MDWVQSCNCLHKVTKRERDGAERCRSEKPPSEASKKNKRERARAERCVCTVQVWEAKSRVSIRSLPEEHRREIAQIYFRQDSNLGLTDGSLSRLKKLFPNDRCRYSVIRFQTGYHVDCAPGVVFFIFTSSRGGILMFTALGVTHQNQPFSKGGVTMPGFVYLLIHKWFMSWMVCLGKIWSRMSPKDT